MTPEEFSKQMARWQHELSDAVNNVLPVEAGNKAVELFRENFDAGGFFGKPWAPTKGKSGKFSAKTLVQSGDLSRSFKIIPKRGSVIVESDLPYSEIHNSGGEIRQTVTAKQSRWMGANLRTADGKAMGRKAGSTLTIPVPQRQFMGDDPKLRAEINRVIEDEINRIFNK